MTFAYCVLRLFPNQTPKDPKKISFLFLSLSFNTALTEYKYQINTPFGVILNNLGLFEIVWD